MSETMDAAAREQAMIVATLMDLGSARANHIRTTQTERHRAADAKALESSRRANFAGSQEAKWAAQAANAEALTSWNSFVTTANPNAEPEDGTAGQSHRARMVENMRIASSQAVPSRGGHSGRGGRGGGIVGRALVRGSRKTLVRGQELPRHFSGGKSTRGHGTGQQSSRSSGSRDEQLVSLFNTLKLGNHKVELPKSKMTGGKASATTEVAKLKPKHNVEPRAPIAPQSHLISASSFVESFQKMPGLGAKVKSSQTPASTESKNPPSSPEHVALEKPENQSHGHKATSSKDFGEETLGHLIKNMEPAKSAADVPFDSFAPRPEPITSSVVESSSVASPSSPSGLGSEPASSSARKIPMGGRSKLSTIQDIAANVNRYAAMTRKAAEQNTRGRAFVSMHSSIASPISSSPEVTGSAAVPASVAVETDSGFVSTPNITEKTSGAIPDFASSTNALGSNVKSITGFAEPAKTPSLFTVNTGFGFGQTSDTTIKTIQNPQRFGSSTSAPSKDVEDFRKTVGEDQSRPKAQKKSKRPIPAGLALLEKAAAIEKAAKEISKLPVTASSFTSAHESTLTKKFSELADPIPVLTSSNTLTTADKDISAQHAAETRSSPIAPISSGVSFKIPQKAQERSKHPIPSGFTSINMSKKNNTDVLEACKTRSSVSGTSSNPTLGSTSAQMTSGTRGPFTEFVPAEKTAEISKFSAINQSLGQSKTLAPRSARPLGAPGLESSAFNRGRKFDKVWSVSPGARPVPAGLKFIQAANAEYSSDKVAKETKKLPDLDALPPSLSNMPRRTVSFQHGRRYRESFPMPSPGETYDQVIARLEKEYRGDEDVEMADDDDEEL